jgi:RHS repeat-associated protein
MERNERSATFVGKSLVNSNAKLIGAIALTSAFGFLAVTAYAMFASLPGSIRVAPLSLAVHSSSTLPAEVQALEAQTAPLLFDRDTGTAHVAYADQTLDAQLERPTEIQSIKVFGAAPYELTVQAQQGGAWNTISGLNKLKLSNQSPAWNTFQPTQAVTAGALRFLLTLPPGNGGGGGGKGGKGNTVTTPTSGGLSEIEIWATGEHALLNGAALVAAMQGNVQSGTASQPKPAQARSYAATPASATVGKDAQSFSFTLDRPAARFKRAWLAYEAYGLAHWVSPVRRINGLALQGGAFTFSGTDWTSLVEPVHPDWLATGKNRIDFYLPANLAGNYSVRNVRVVAELDDGNNFIARATTIAGATAKIAGSEIDAPVLIDGDFTTGWSPYVDPRSKGSNPTVTLYFDKPTQLDTLSLNLVNAFSGTMSVDLLVGGQWQNAGIPAINGKKLTAGWNNITGFAQVPADALRITFQNGTGSPGEIREIAATGSGTGAAYVPAINVAYPDAGQFYGREAYIRGFLSVPDNGTGPAAVTIGGKSVSTSDGSFGLVVSKEDAGYAKQADAEPWEVEVDALYPDGQKLVQIVKLTQGYDASKAHGLLPNVANPGFAEMLAVADASIEIDPDAMDPGVKIKIIPLAEKDLPRLDPGMTNVTRGPHKGYRFTPTPYKFKKNIKVTLPFDAAFVPRGHTEDDIRTYYFDTQAGHWVPLDRVLVDGGKKKVTSLTNHFTDMINATMTVPDHPEAMSFNPTQIKDIKAADPGAGINLIEPPQANNTGDARLSYPIEIPQGRQGMQPQLAISYNSGGGNGWLGLGWDLSVPSISIETRWGVPRYDAAKETETYLLNGEMLTPVAHRGILQNRTAEKIFHTRVEGQFRKIIRHGSTPANYWWEVIDKNGTKNYYGATGTSQDAGTILTALTPQGAVKGVFKWALKETVDNNGNSVTYQYQRVTNHVIPGGTTAGQQLYVQSINYTGHNGAPGAYTVSFIRETGRPDITTDARGGFKQVTADRLKTIEVKYQTQTVRSYVLNYAIGAFEKSLLSSIAQKGTNGVQFNEHRFDYYDDIRKTDLTYKGFLAAKTVDMGSDELKSETKAGAFKHTVLGGTKGSSQGLDGYVGVGFIGTKMISGGVGFGASQSKAKGTNSFIDVDGDGLPDKVFLTNDGAFYRQNKTLTGNLRQMNFDTGVKKDVPNFAPPSENNSSTSNLSVQGFVVGITANGGQSTTRSRDSSYLSDVNGDGLVDIVSQGGVLFNTARNTGMAGFSRNSYDSDLPLGAIGGSVDKEILPDVSAARLQLEAENPLMDNVRRWVAPYDGRVRISGAVQLVDFSTDSRFTAEQHQDRLDYKQADGVMASIQLNGAAPLWSQRIEASDYAEHQPTNVDSIAVSKGDRIHFRVQSVIDGEYDQLAWSPKVEYVSGGTALATLDVNNRNAYRFQAGEDFVIAGRPITMTTPYRGKLRLSGILNKTAVTTDDVTVRVTVINRVYNMNGTVQSDPSQVVVSKKLAWDSVGPVTLAEDFEVGRYASVMTDIVVDSPIDLSVLKWGDLASGETQKPGMPQFYYTEAYQEAEQPLAPGSIASDQPTPTNADQVKPTGTADMAPILDENGNPIMIPAKQLDVYKADGTPKYTMPVKYDADIYSQNHLNAPQQSWVAPRDGVVMVTPWVKMTLYSHRDPETGITTEVPNDVSGDINFTVKRRLEHIGKQRVVVAGGQVQKTSQGYHGLKLIKVKKGEEIFFDFSVRDPKLEAEVQSAVARVHYASDTPWRVPLTDTVHYLANAAASLSLDPEAVRHTEAMLVIRRGQSEIVHTEIVDFSKGELNLDFAQNVTAGEDWYFDLFTIDSTLNIFTHDAWARYQADSQWVVPASGQVNIFPVLNFKPGASVPDGHVTLIVTDGGTVVAQRSYAVSNGVVDGAQALALGVTKDHVLKFAYVTNDHALSSQLADKGSVRLDYVDSLPWQVPANLANGKIDIDPQINLAGQVGNGSIDFRVLRGNTVLATRAYSVTGGVISSSETGVIPVSVSGGTTLSFEYRSVQPDIANAIKGSKVKVTLLQNIDGLNKSSTISVPFSVNLVNQVVGSNTFHILMPHKFAVQEQQAAERHFPLNDPLFGNPYRGWANAAYNGNGTRAAKPIDELKFVMSQNENDYKDSTIQPDAWFAYPAVEQDRWLNQDSLWWTSPLEVSASRKGIDNVYDPTLEDYSEKKEVGYAAAARPPRMSETNQKVSGFGFVLSKTLSDNTTTNQLDLMDMNGDRFPDILGPNVTQYTWADGTFYDAVASGPARGSSDKQTSVGLSVGIPTSAAAAKGYLASLVGADTDSKEKSSISIGGSVSTGTNGTNYDLIDVNGDGLPDRVTPVAGGLDVRLNTGYGFEATGSTWVGGQLTQGTSSGKSLNAGFSMWNGAFGGGASVSESHNYTQTTLMDINGDGLPDIVSTGTDKLIVRFNNGAGFGSANNWPGALPAYSNLKNKTIGATSLGDGTSTSGSVSAKVGYGFQVWFITISFSVGINGGETVGQPSLQYTDVNGDGFVDGVRSADDSVIEVALNPIQRTNMLRQVRRPLGAYFDIDYTRTGNTYDQPQSKWVMAEVRVFDGVANDTPSLPEWQSRGSDWQRNSYAYANGKYDRFERDFLGFDKVTSIQHDTAGLHGTGITPAQLKSTPAYRKTEQIYANSSFYDKGLLLSETMFDASGRRYVETVNRYEFWKLGDALGAITDPLQLARFGDRASATLFPRLTRTDKRFYEGQSNAGQSSYTEHVYDTLGNITHFAEGGDGIEPVAAQIDYTNCSASYIVGMPRKITVFGNGNEMRRREGDFDCTSGNLNRQRAYIDASRYAETTFDWDEYGNLFTIVGAPNHKGDQMTLAYIYDDDTHSYPARIDNVSYRIHSTATYDPKWGKPLTTTDTNGNVIAYTYDSFGRTQSVLGPQEQAAGQAYTIRFGYTPYINLDLAPVASRARTEHADRDVASNGQVSYKADPIDTMLFTDGMKRVLQTKKDASVSEGNGVAAQDKMIVSGRVAMDALGRSIAQYYPTAQTKGNADTTFDTSVDTSASPTVTDYDVLDRATRTALPDGTITSMAYGFDKDAFGYQRFQTTVTDANGNQKKSFRDVRELITTVVEENRSFNNQGVPTSTSKAPITTRYVYDPLKQITRVIDAAGNLTDVEYDNLGRRTVIDNPDTGRVETVYDTASNPIRKITANLRKLGAGQALEYDYDHTRLSAIRHPLYPDANVTYTYGSDADRARNQAGRVKSVTHQSGTEVREYGTLGETVKETLTLTAAANGGSTPPVYTTQYAFDSFGRLHRLTMPDGEIITNHYDSGGNLNAVDGTLNGRPYKYLERLDYDRFEQRVFLKVGNGVETQYTYAANNRRLSRLVSGSPGKNAMQDMAYGYDSVGNILSLIDTAPIPRTNEYGGQSTQHFHYDDLYRLVKADGVYTTAREVQNYDVAMAYTPIHNITHKNQLHTVSKIGGTPRTEAATSYDWAYTYKDNNHTQPHAPTHIGERSYSYDANGNQSGWQNDANGSRRTIVWNEDNRIREVQDPKHGAAFTYDDQGERKLRKSQYGEVAYINQFFSVRNGAIASTHVYAGNSRLVTKVGAGTPVGKTTNLKGTGNLSPSAPTGGSIVVADVTGGSTATLPATAGTATTTPSPQRGEGGGEGKAASSFPGQGIEHRSDRANEVARNTEKNKHLNGGNPGGDSGAVNSNKGGNGNAAGTSNNPGNTGGTGGNNAGGNGGGVGVGNGSGGNTGSGQSQGGAGQGNGREFIYFYHPDHLGSTGYVTDEKALRYEHIAYFPFGETWVQEASATWRVPYQFTSKEMDSETGLYYFGARYYDPRTSVWQSADPILEKYLPSGGDSSNLAGMGGVFNPFNLGLYAYAHHNPAKFTDPDGNESKFMAFWAIEYDRSSPTGGAYFAVNIHDQGSGPGGLGINIETGTNWVTRGVNKTDPANQVAGGGQVATEAGKYQFTVVDKGVNPITHKGKGLVPRLNDGGEIPTLRPNAAQDGKSVATGILLHGMNKNGKVNDSDHGGATYFGSEGCNGPSNGYKPMGVMKGSQPGDTGTYRLMRPAEAIDKLVNWFKGPGD